MSESSYSGENMNTTRKVTTEKAKLAILFESEKKNMRKVNSLERKNNNFLRMHRLFMLQNCHKAKKQQHLPCGQFILWSTVYIKQQVDISKCHNLIALLKTNLKTISRGKSKNISG